LSAKCVVIFVANFFNQEPYIYYHVLADPLFIPICVMPYFPITQPFLVCYNYDGITKSGRLRGMPKATWFLAEISCNYRRLLDFGVCCRNCASYTDLGLHRLPLHSLRPSRFQHCLLLCFYLL